MPAQDPAAAQIASAPVNAWKTLIRSTPRVVRVVLQDIFRTHEGDLRQVYRKFLDSDPEIGAVIGDCVAGDKFTEVFMTWVMQVTDPDLTGTSWMLRRQEELGEMLARIGYPPQAAVAEMCLLKLWFIGYLEQQDLPKSFYTEVIRFVISLVDISFQLRSMGYQRGAVAAIRQGEAYRLYSLGGNMGAERERQRIALLEWGHQLLWEVHQGKPGTLARLGQSEFGRWLNHKARLLFEREPLLRAASEVANRIDTDLLPALERAADSPPARRTLIQEVENGLTNIRFALDRLFDQQADIESGRDPMTHLLNQRFLASVLLREVHLQKKPGSQGFSVLVAQIDGLETIRRERGRTLADSVLLETANAISNCVRTTDFLFRCDDDRIAAILVDTDGAHGLDVANAIRTAVAGVASRLPSLQAPVTISLGLAAYAGELDYQVLLERAGAALQEASQAGGDRLVTAG